MSNKAFIVTDNTFFGHEVKDLMKKDEQGFEFLGFVMTNFTRISKSENIVGDISELARVNHHSYVALAIKDNKKREQIFKMLSKNKNIEFITLIHPSCFISSEVTIKKGSILFGNTRINDNTSIGKCFILEHNSVIGKNVRITKFCSIGTGSFLGENSVMLKGSRLSELTYFFGDIVLGEYEVTPTKQISL